MPRLDDLDGPTCVTLLTSGVFGRFGLSTPHGLEIVAVNYAVQGEAVVVRTEPDRTLARHGVGSDLVFEVDEVDHEYWRGYSVVARGVGELMETPAAPTPGFKRPRPWADGDRSCLFRMRWSELRGRSVGRRPDVASLLAPRRTL